VDPTGLDVGNPGKSELLLNDEKRIEINTSLVESAISGNADASKALDAKVSRGEIGEVFVGEQRTPILTIGSVNIRPAPSNLLKRYIDPATGDVLGDQEYILGSMPGVAVTIDGKKGFLDKIAEKLQPGPKRDPNAPHNKKIGEVADQLEAEGNLIIAGGMREQEQLIRTPGGVKSGRRPDIIYKTPIGEKKAVNVGKTDSKGEPVKREKEAQRDLNENGDLPTTFVPYE
jgi:hypothetical protein